MPWRGSHDPYAIWVSEVMLQQTQVATVTPYYLRFMQRFPTLESLAQAPEQDVLAHWAGLGYYSRARNLQAAARRIMTEHAGQFPRQFALVRSLPGIGEYTAGAILSIAFAEPVPAVDGNVERVLCRALEIEGDPKKKPAREQIRAAASALAQCDRPGDLNQALMELGATVCSPRNPDCAACPWGALCGAKASSRQEALPRMPPRAALVKCANAAAIIQRGGRVLIAQRPEGAVWAGLWEFPQAEDVGQDAANALAEHVRESLGLEVIVRGLVFKVRHGVMNKAITLSVYECEAKAGELRPVGYADARWVKLEALGEYPASSPHTKIAGMLMDREGRLDFS